jgi:pimeloyl-ACP methyl ester carboxylesterase
MPYVTVGRENSGDIDLYYEDHGSGPPVVLIHGWPLSGRAWEKQVPALLDGGFRVITYDRRGFGDSSRPVSGYDYDTFATDLKALMTKLDLHDSTLVGFSMGGGEVARYLRTYGTARVSKAVFIAAIPPYLPKSDDNPAGVDPGGFEEIQKSLKADRLLFLTGFFSKFYNVDVLGGREISDEVVRLSWHIASGASPKGTSDCVSAWLTDFRTDLAVIDIPTLVIHGDADRILPIAATGERIHDAVKGSQFVVIEDGPHGLTWTHAEKVNTALLEFLGRR